MKLRFILFVIPVILMIGITIYGSMNKLPELDDYSDWDEVYQLILDNYQVEAIVINDEKDYEFDVKLNGDDRLSITNSKILIDNYMDSVIGELTMENHVVINYYLENKLVANCTSIGDVFDDKTKYRIEFYD